MRNQRGIEVTRRLSIPGPFNLALTLTMGQTFRWRPFGDDWFSGVVGLHLFHVRQIDGGIEYEAASLPGHVDDPDECLHRYFRLDDDIDVIYASIARDPKVSTIMREFPGLRLLRQDPWECLVSQICVARTSIGHTIGMVSNIANNFGSAIELAGEVRYTFPAAEQLMADRQGVLGKLQEMSKGQDHASDIIAAAQWVCDAGPDWGALRRQPYGEVNRRLLQCPGVDDRIADCIALFALDRLEAFPVDIWVWLAISGICPELGSQEQAEPDKWELAAVAKRARSEFGEYAGYASQYLFHWRREYSDKLQPLDTRPSERFGTEPVYDHRYEYLARKYLS